MSIRAVPNLNTNPVQIQVSGVNYQTVTTTEARVLRDDLTRVLGDGTEKAKRAVLLGAVADAAKKWNRIYSSLPNYGGDVETRLALQRAVNDLAAFDNGGRPIPNFDTGVYGARQYTKNINGTARF